MLNKKLNNGLEFFIYEDNRTPTVSFVILYNVGSMDEHPGITGASHILEHMTFKGSDKVNGTELNLAVRRHGGYMNAATHEDRTVYIMTMPKSEREYIFSTWSDLMVNAHIDENEFASERNVVIEERRLHSEDDPIGALFEALNATAYWAHPYRWPIIGWMSDLENMSHKQVYDYYKTYYRPDNALVMVKGDVDQEETADLLYKYFGGISPAANPIPRSMTAEPPQSGMRRTSIQKPAELPIVMMGFHAPNLIEPAVYPLLVCEKILSSGESSRIYRNIIHEKRLSTGAGGFYDYLSRDPGLFIFYAQAAPDKDIEILEQSLWDEIDRINAGDINLEEIEKAKNIVESQFVYRQEKNLNEALTRGEFNLLSDMSTYDNFVDTLRQVKKEDIVNVCNMILQKNNATVVDLKPLKPAGGGSSVHPVNLVEYTQCNFQSSGFTKNSDKPDGLKIWEDADRFELSNGIKVIALKRDNLPIFNLDMFFQAGSSFDPENKGGLATLTGNLLKAGTGSRSAADIAEEIERVGGKFNVGIGRETLFCGVQSLSRYSKTAIDVLSECLIYPTFDDLEVDRYKELQSGDIKAIEDDVWRLAPREFVRNLYSGSPYGHPVMGDLQTVDSITRDDVLNFHETNLTGSNAIMSVVGDFDSDQLRDDLEFYFSKMNKGKVISPSEFKPENYEKIDVKRYNKDTSQASLVLGSYSFPRISDDYFPYLIMNLIFGGDSITSRIGDAVREQHGLAYYVQSSFSPMKKTGYWNILMQTKNESVGQAVSLIRSEIRRIRDEYITDEEISDAKSSFRGRSSLEIETNRGVAMKLLSVLYYDLGDDYLSSFFRNIDSVTKDQVRDVAAKYLDPDRFMLMIVGNEEETLLDI